MKQENTPGKAMKSQSTDRDGCHVSGERWLMIVTSLVLGGYVPLELLPNDACEMINSMIDHKCLFSSEVDTRCGASKNRTIVYTTTVDAISAVESILSEFRFETDENWPLYLNATFCRGADTEPCAQVNVHQKS